MRQTFNHNQSQQSSGARGRVQTYAPQRSAHNYDHQSTGGWGQQNTANFQKESPNPNQMGTMQTNAQESRNQSDSPDLKITTIVSNKKRGVLSDDQSSYQRPRYGDSNANGSNRNIDSDYMNDQQRALQPQSIRGGATDTSHLNQRSQNYGAMPSSNDQPLNLNFGQQQRGAQPRANNGNARGPANRGGHPGQFSPRSGNSGFGAHPLSSDDDMGNLDEGYDRPPSQFQRQPAVHGQENRLAPADQQSVGARVTRMSAAGRGPQPAGPSNRSNQMNQSTNTVDPKPQDLQKIQEELRMLEKEKEKRELERQRQSVRPAPEQNSMQMSRREKEAIVDAYKSDNFGEDDAEEERSLQMAQLQQDVDPRHSREMQMQMQMQPKREVKSRVPPPQTQNWMPPMAEAEQMNQYQPHQRKDELDQVPPADVYKDIYHQVMRSKSPAGAQHRILNDKLSSFEVYKDGWNQIQDKMDKNYQKRLRQVNKEAAKRMQDALERQEQRLQQNALKYKQQQTDQMMEECTFSPRIDVSNATRRQGPVRSTKAFYEAQQQFAAKRQNRLQNARNEQQVAAKQMQTKQFMNPGSRKILRDNSRTLSKSASHNQFLERNYYGAKDKSASRITAERDKSDTSRNRDLSASNNYVRDISGSKISFLNSSSQIFGKGKAKYSAAGERLFSPKINDRSKLMSPRDKDSTFYMLHQQAINQQRKQYIKEYQAEREAQLTANRGIQEIVNNKSDAYLAKQFYTEFCQVIQQQIEKSNQIYLVDVLDQLHFIDEELLAKQSVKVKSLLNQQKRTLYIDTEAGQFQGESEDITKNLFKVCCAILNLRPKQRGQNPLDDYVLGKFLDTVQDTEGLRETLVIEQLQMIKALVNRKAFSLTDRQIILINRKFHNMSVNRKSFLFNQKKAEKLGRVQQETTPLFSPKINTKSKHLDTSQTRQGRSKQRTEQIYAYAAKYDEHKKQLRQAYTEKEVEGLNFQPKLNARSVRMAQESHGNFTDRTMGQYLNKHRRMDKDPNQIDFERQQQECTFKPTITTSRSIPNLAAPLNDSRSPATRGQPGEAQKSKELSAKKHNPVMTRNLQFTEDSPEVQEQNMEDDLAAVQQQPPAPQLGQFMAKQPPPRREAPEPKSAQPTAAQGRALPMSHGGYQLPVPEDSYRQDQQSAKSVPEKQNRRSSPEQQQDSAQPFPSKSRPSPEKLYDKEQPPNSISTPQFQQQQPLPPRHGPGMGRINRHLPSFLPVVEEPICVLKIELDGEHIEEIKVFENDDPNEIVKKFGNDFNLSQNARQRLLEQIQEQIQMDDY